MIRVVLDTNVLVSAVIGTRGPNAEIFDLAPSGNGATRHRPRASLACRSVFYGEVAA